MRIPHSMRLLAAACFVGALLPSVCRAQLTVVEDFSTTALRDAAATTANWDPVAAKLTLPPFQDQTVGTVALAGSGDVLAVAGDFAYVGGGTSVYVVDTSDPTAPSVVTTLTTAGTVKAIATQRNLLYVCAFWGGLQIYDISAPSAPVLMSTYTAPTPVHGVDAQGSLLYVTTMDQVQVLDARNPASPTLIGVYSAVGSARAVDVEGPIAYVASNTGGVEVLDVSVAVTPTLVATIATAFDANAVVADGSHLYVAETTVANTSVIQIYDISDPTAPVLASTYSPTGTVDRMFLEGSTLYVPHTLPGFEIVDVSDPTAPARVRTVSMSYATRDVVVHGEHAYVADVGGNFVVVESRQVVAPIFVDRRTFASGGPRPVIVDGLAFTGMGVSGMEILDFHSPGLPTTGSIGTAGSVLEVEVVGSTAFLTAFSAGLEIVDVSDPSNPVVLGGYDPVENVTSAAVQGNFAMLAAGTKIYTVDVGNPSAPALVGTYTSASAAHQKIRVVGNRAYVCMANAALSILDVADPFAISFLDQIPLTATSAIPPTIDGDYAYVAEGGAQLGIFDLRTKARVASIPGNISSVSIAGDVLYVVDFVNGLKTFDIRTPSAPVQIGTRRPFASGPSWIELSGSRAAVAYGSTIDVLDVMQSSYDQDGNLATSLPVATTTSSFQRARLQSYGSGLVAWELSADGGANWQSVSSGTDWFTLNTPGSSLRWRSTLTWNGATLPEVDSVQIEVLDDAPRIESITDVGHDQGGQVRLEWSRSAHDFVGDAQQITEYAVYRRVEPGYSMAKAAGAWDFVTAVPVRVQDRYSTVVPTIADSTVAQGQHLSTFRVTALTATPGVFFDSAADSGYSVDNLAPSIPQALVANYQAQSVGLDWQDNLESDLSHYRIYRGSSPDFVPSAATMVRETVNSTWTDASANPWGFYYKVSAVDVSGNESPMAIVQTATDAPTATARFELRAAVPNPFNPRTTIRYSLERAGRTELRIYNAAGRVVRTVVRDNESAGEHDFVWTGVDDAGRSVASGVYFYELRSGDRVARQRMVLVR